MCSASSSDQRIRLTAKAKQLRRRVLQEIGTIVGPDSVRRNVRQLGEGDDGRRPRYVATVVSAISMPNVWSSP